MYQKVNGLFEDFISGFFLVLVTELYVIGDYEVAKI